VFAFHLDAGFGFSINSSGQKLGNDSKPLASDAAMTVVYGIAGSH
jgi:hypothetical protein